MLYVVIGLFAVAAVMGAVIANAIISGRSSTPKPAVFGHGLFAVAALGLLIYYALQNPDYPQLALILFVVAAVGGIILLVRDLQKKPGPVALVVIHALVAVSAFVILLVFAIF